MMMICNFSCEERLGRACVRPVRGVAYLPAARGATYPVVGPVWPDLAQQVDGAQMIVGFSGESDG